MILLGKALAGATIFRHGSSHKTDGEASKRCQTIATNGVGVREREQNGDKALPPIEGFIRYEERTDDIIVRVEPEFLPEQSNPSDSRYIWAYTVEIDNQSPHDLTVMERFWQIADSRGQVHEVRGSGVVGEHPVVRSGETFRYTSGAPLTAPSGMMRGSYKVKGKDGACFDIAVPTFLLDSPHEGLILN